MKQINYKKLILPNIPYVFFVYLFDKVGQAVRLAPGADISAKILNITKGFSAAFENALPSVYPLDLLVGIVGAVVIRLIVYVWKSHATLTLLANQDLPTFGYNMIDPLKPWCWGSILFYTFKISRFS